MKTHRCERRTRCFRRRQHEQTGRATDLGGQLQPACIAVVQVPRQGRPNRRHGLAPQGLIECPNAVATVMASAPHDAVRRDSACDRSGGVKCFVGVDHNHRAGLIGDRGGRGDHRERARTAGIAGGHPFTDLATFESPAGQPSVEGRRTGRENAGGFHRGAGRDRGGPAAEVRHQGLASRLARTLAVTLPGMMLGRGRRTRGQSRRS